MPVCERCGQQHSAGPWCEQAQALHGEAVRAAQASGAPKAPTAPVVLNGPPAPAGLLPPGAAQKHQPVPYLGNDPMPSARYGTAMQIVTAAAATVAVAQAMVLHTRGRISQRIASGDLASSDAWTGKTNLLVGLGLFRAALVVGALVTGWLWRRSRRPKDLLIHGGEAHVELPLTWIVPTWLRYLPGGLIFVGVAVGVAVMPDPTMQLDYEQAAAADRAGMIGALCWAAAWSTLAYWPVISERTYAVRLAWSAWYRERPGSVPFVMPVADRPSTIGTPAGGAWVLRTAGLVVLSLVGFIGTLSAVSSLVSDTVPAFITLVLLVPLDIVLVRTFLRRLQTPSTPPVGVAPAMPAPPPGALPGPYGAPVPYSPPGVPAPTGAPPATSAPGSTVTWF